MIPDGHWSDVVGSMEKISGKEKKKLDIESPLRIYRLLIEEVLEISTIR